MEIGNHPLLPVTPIKHSQLQVQFINKFLKIQPNQKQKIETRIKYLRLRIQNVVDIKENMQMLSRKIETVQVIDYRQFPSLIEQFSSKIIDLQDRITIHKLNIQTKLKRMQKQFDHNYLFLNMLHPINIKQQKAELFLLRQNLVIRQQILSELQNLQRFLCFAQMKIDQFQQFKNE